MCWYGPCQRCAAGVLQGSGWMPGAMHALAPSTWCCRGFPKCGGQFLRLALRIQAALAHTNALHGALGSRARGAGLQAHRAWSSGSSKSIPWVGGWGFRHFISIPKLIIYTRHYWSPELNNKCSMRTCSYISVLISLQ